jgi:hypothetical protein
MDLEETKAKNDCAGEDQQKSDRLNKLVVFSPQSDPMYYVDIQHTQYSVEFPMWRQVQIPPL